MLEYLIELRQRILKCIVFVSMLFVLLFYFGQQLFIILAKPMLDHLAPGQSLVAIGIATPLVTPLRLSFYASLFFCMPYLLYQFWAFISPALYPRERRITWFAVFPSVILFYLGVAFAYFFVFPMIFGFFTSVLPEGINFLPDMDHYLDFALQLFLAFGLCFQVPLITVILVLCNLMSIEKLIEARPYVIVIAFFLGMILTPPDVLSQILLAVPMCLLYELGIVASRLLKRQFSEIKEEAQPE